MVPLALAVAAAAALAVALGAPPQELCTSPGERCRIQVRRPAYCKSLAVGQHPSGACLKEANAARTLHLTASCGDKR